MAHRALLVIASAIACGRILASSTCQRDTCQNDIDEDVHEVSLLQNGVLTQKVVVDGVGSAPQVNEQENRVESKVTCVAGETQVREELYVENEHVDDDHDEQPRALLSRRSMESSDDDATGIGKSIKKKIKKWIKSAEKKARKEVSDTISDLQSPTRFRSLLPNCLKEGDVEDCLPIPSASFVSTRVTALKDSITNLKDCFRLPDLTRVLSGINCGSSQTITYPTGVNANWRPNVLTDSESICTSVNGLDLNLLKSIGNQIKNNNTCAKTIYNTISGAINSVSPSSGCECADSFAIYFGAGLSAAAGLNVDFSAGFILGCDGCNLQIKAWWAGQIGVTTNVAADVGAFVGYAHTWNRFWGIGRVFEVSGGPNVVGVGVGVGITLPQIIINTQDTKIEKKACVSGKCVTIKQTVSNLPSNVAFVPPDFATIEFGISAGLSILPADYTDAMTYTEKIDL